MSEPRCTSLKQAAAHAGLTATSFKDWVRKGILPGPIPGTRVYDRRAIDAKRYQFKPRQVGEPRVYFVRFADYRKIGWTSDLPARLVDLEKNLPKPLTILHSRPGSKADEWALHKQFSHLRLRGEWFRVVPELLDFIEQKKADGP